MASLNSERLPITFSNLKKVELWRNLFPISLNILVDSADSSNEEQDNIVKGDSGFCSANSKENLFTSEKSSRNVDKRKTILIIITIYLFVIFFCHINTKLLVQIFLFRLKYSFFLQKLSHLRISFTIEATETDGGYEPTKITKENSSAKKSEPKDVEGNFSANKLTIQVILLKTRMTISLISKLIRWTLLKVKRSN